MTDGNNISLSTDGKVKMVEVYSQYEFIEAYSYNVLFENELFRDILCDNISLYKVVHSCLATPSDFYDGIDLAFDDWWAAVLDEYFRKHDGHKKISFDELLESLFRFD